MASATKYTWERKDGTTGKGWRAVWTGPDGRKRFKRGFDRQGDALAFANDREAESRHGVTLTGEALSNRTTVEAWAKQWLASLEVRPGTMTSYRHCAARITKTLGSRSLGGLRPMQIKQWRQQLGQTYATTTVEQTSAVLAMMLRAAVNEGLISRSPMPPSIASKTQRVVDPSEVLSLDQVRAWDAKLPDYARGMALLAAMTGLRQGELLGLRAGSVDFLRHRIRVTEQLVEASPWPRFGPPKTAAGVRVVPLTEQASHLLAEHMRLFPSPDGEPLFLSQRRRRWRRGSFHQVWSTAKAAAGLPEWAHWHALRDVAASSLIYAGVDVRTVMGVLGHATPEETLRTYARIWPSAQDEARKALTRLWTPDSEAQVVTE